MAVFCITTSLKSNNQARLQTAIQSYGLWWHQADNIWFIEVRAGIGAKQIYETLKSYITEEDKIMIIEVKRHWWANGFRDEEYVWLKDRNF